MLGLGVTPEAALAGCFVAAVIVAVLALVRALHAILSSVPNSIKLAVVRRSPFRDTGCRGRGQMGSPLGVSPLRTTCT